MVTMEDSSKERGTWTFKDGQLILHCATDDVTVIADEPFTYTSARSAQSYQFKLSQADFETLKKMR